MQHPNAELVNPFGIRIATHSDVDTVIQMIAAHHVESPYTTYKFSPRRAKSFLLSLIHGAGVILVTETGCLAGQIITPHMSDDVTAVEIVWFSLASGDKKKAECKALHEAFEYWAERVIHAEVIHTGSYHKARYLTDKGYTQLDTAYAKRLR